MEPGAPRRWRDLLAIGALWLLLTLVSWSQAARDYLDAPGARYWVFRNGIFPRMEAFWGYFGVLERDYDLTNLRSTAAFVRLMWDVRQAGERRWAEMFMSMSGARYRALYRPPREGWADGSVRDVQPIILLEQDRCPRYSFAKRAVQTTSVEELRAHLVNGDWSPGTAYLSGPPVPCAPGRVLGVDERSTAVDLDVEADGDALLVLSITNHRYWKADLDGRPAPIIPTNLTYMGVAVPQGRHQISFRYRNPVVVLSLVLSLSTALALLVVALRDRQRLRSGLRSAENGSMRPGSTSRATVSSSSGERTAVTAARRSAFRRSAAFSRFTPSDRRMTPWVARDALRWARTPRDLQRLPARRGNLRRAYPYKEAAEALR